MHSIDVHPVLGAGHWATFPVLSWPHASALGWGHRSPQPTLMEGQGSRLAASPLQLHGNAVAPLQHGLLTLPFSGDMGQLSCSRRALFLPPPCRAPKYSGEVRTKLLVPDHPGWEKLPGPHKCPPSSPPWGPGPVHGLHTKLGPTRMRAGLGSRSEPTAGKATQQMSPKHLGDAGGMTSSLLLTQQLIKSIRSHYMPIWSSSNLTSSVRGVMVRGSLLPIWL